MTSKKALRRKLRAVTEECDQAQGRVGALEYQARLLLSHLDNIDRDEQPGLWRAAYTLDGLVKREQRQIPGYTLTELYEVRKKLVDSWPWSTDRVTVTAQPTEYTVINNPDDAVRQVFREAFDRPIDHEAIEGEAA